MKVIVLGGSGLQGKAAIQDLSKNNHVKEVICADVDFSAIDDFAEHLNMNKVVKVKVDATSVTSLESLFSDNVDVIINLLPKPFHDIVTKQSIKSKIPLVNSSYANVLSEEIHDLANKEQVAIMPEAGLDPGIDLILCGYGVSQLDKVTELYSYSGGVPERSAVDNPLQYKLTWNMDSVLMSYMRSARMKRNGEIIDIPAENQHDSEWITNMTLSDVEGLELIPNGDAIGFTEILGIDKEIINTERKTIRWSGHSDIWRPLIKLGFLENEPVPNIEPDITPRQFLSKHLEQRLKYKDKEKDLVLMKNIIKGEKDGKNVEIVYELIDERDLETGLFAMNRTVGYTASIVAQMLSDGTIKGKGMLSPTKDIPYEKFINEIRKRGIKIQESVREI